MFGKDYYCKVYLIERAYLFIYLFIYLFFFFEGGSGTTYVRLYLSKNGQSFSS